MVDIENKKVVLAYSGGLDTSCILFWLKDQGYDVICYTADVGQEEDFELLKKRAITLGATKAIVDNRQSEFVNQFIYPSLAFGGIYQGRYLLGTSLARPSIAKGIIEAALKENAAFVAHGATGKGNDQIRFELSCASLHPSIKCIAPWRLPEFYTRFRGRSDLMSYAKEKGFEIKQTPSKSFSTDDNMMHISFESGILENPAEPAPEDTYQMTRHPREWPIKADDLTITLEKGMPVKVVNSMTNEAVTTPVEILKYLNSLGCKHGIGRIDIVEDRFIGMKSRGVYETPGATIIYAAVRDLEVCCLDMEVNKIKSYLANIFAEKVYNGLWFSPECEYVRHCLETSQQDVNGYVNVRLLCGNVFITGRKANKSLYDKELVSMDEQGRFTPKHAEGFIRTQAIRLNTFRAVHDYSPYSGKQWGQ